ncbi:MAG: UDP-N-acetylmuramoyl-L-alanine--D-glutamate ligase [Candidatus Gracilibacteria bacterium]
MQKTDKIAILGYGVEGRAMCEYLLRHGYSDLTVCDQSASIDIPSGVKLRGGDEYLHGLSDFDVVFRSPGTSYFKKEIQEIASDLDAHTVISSMTKYFFDECKCPIIGVTGTKGKGTTSSLITEILRRSGRKVFLGGNIGVPSVSFLDELSENSLVVLELSSFQLVDLERSPHIGVVLNVTSDHLDYHSSIEEYHESKYPIIEFQSEADFAILNSDYAYAGEFGALGDGQKIYVSCRSEEVNGAWVGARGRDAWEDTTDAARIDPALPRAVYYLGAEDVDSRERYPRHNYVKLIDTSAIALLGRHNLENVLPAVSVARILGVSDAIIADALREFRGLPHRLEPVHAIDVDVNHRARISFYNDSFSTTPDTCLAACSTFNDLGKPFFLIAGGSEKWSDFTNLGWKLSQMPMLQKVFLMGPSGVRIGDAIVAGHATCVEDGTVCRLPVVCEVVDTLEEAVKKAYVEAKNLTLDSVNHEAVILMSPAAASFNEFKNYKERGEKFGEVAKWVTKETAK